MPSELEKILVINKPKGLTSHDVVNVVRKISKERRVGNAGTLDPLASGVLIVLVGRAATKRQAEFMNADKEYTAEITFGKVSKTYDAEGPLTVTASAEKLEKLSPKIIKDACQNFIGKFKQKPPAFSAIKVKGVALYKKARRGNLNEAEIPIKEVEINSITLLKYQTTDKESFPKIWLKIKCQKGVYIRSLAQDLGEKLGVGAYLSELVRTRVGQYVVEQALDLQSLTNKYENLH